MIPHFWQDATAYLSRQDPKMAGIIASYEGETLSSQKDAFTTLLRSITGQQVSVKAAAAIWSRIEAGVGKMDPKTVSRHSPEKLRAYGLSGSKVRYMQGIAKHFLENPGYEHTLEAMEDEALIKALIALPGIGRWTAEMLMIFHFLRPDVLPIADLGLQKAVAKHYGGAPSPEKVTRTAKKWKPYRSVATWYLWRSLDPVPVVY